MSQQHGSKSRLPSALIHHAATSRAAAARSYSTPAGPRSAVQSWAHEPPSTRGPALPPINPRASDDCTPRSSLGMHSILNPSSDGGSAGSKARSRTVSRVGSTGDEQRNEHAHASSDAHGRAISPFSPIYRSHSLGTVGTLNRNANAPKSLTLSSSHAECRSDMASSISNQPLSTSPATRRSIHNFSSVPPPPPSPLSMLQTRSQRTRSAMSQPLQPHSANVSPGGWYSFKPAIQSSPAPSLGEAGQPGSPASAQPPLFSAPAPAHASSQASDHPDGIPVASTGQSNYQLLTLETNQGHVQIPVDVQAASKMADEKRKRNAGASARFRARRKEKEREASSTIARLEQQIREANEDVEYYKHERDYFLKLVYQAPGGDRHFPRPPSPRTRRLSTHALESTGASSDRGSESASSTPGLGFASYSSERRSDERPLGSDRNVRRRTASSYLARLGAAVDQRNDTHVRTQSLPAAYPPLAVASPAPASYTPSRPTQRALQHSTPKRRYPSPYAPRQNDGSWNPPQLAGRVPPPS